MCHSPPCAPSARAKAGSKVSSASGRQAKASAGRVMVATPAIISSAASSTPSTWPNSRCVKSPVSPRRDTMATPSASAIR